ncbi:MAG: hypothetical protein KF819_28720 [Labilithrix sp.]|nr:hypothetical protein [Labilithrix sp.]
MRAGSFLVLGLGVALALGGYACGGTTPTADDADAGDDAAAPDAEPDDSGEPSDAGRDAPVDAPKDSPGPPNGYCAKLSPKPKFCDDFDDGNLIDDWDIPTMVMGKSSMELDDATFTSPPYAFTVAARELTTNGDIANVHLRRTVLGAVGHVTLSFSALYPSLTLTKGAIAIATLDVSSSRFFTLYLRDPDTGGPTLEEINGGMMTKHVLTMLPPAAAWTRITIDLDLAGGAASVSYDAAKALDAEPITAAAGTEATIRVGAVYVYGPTDAFGATYDDVVLDF